MSSSIFCLKVSKRYVSKEISANIHKKAEGFLTWLREAEEEESEEDEEEIQNDGVQFSSTKNQVVKEEEVAKDDGSDIDIDDI